LRGVWAKAVLSDGSEQYEVMSIGEIDAIRGRSKAGSSGPWKTDYPEMAKKTVIRRLFKRLPKSLALLEAIEHDNDTAGVVETVAPPPSRGLGGLRVAGAERGPVVDVQPEAASEPEPAPSFDVEAMRLRCVDALQAVYAPEEAAYGAIGKEIADAARAGDVQALRGVLAVINQRANQE
jgi:recombinational DNA repair protein RecT